jgi:hypothetical protein
MNKFYHHYYHQHYQNHLNDLFNFHNFYFIKISLIKEKSNHKTSELKIKLKNLIPRLFKLLADFNRSFIKLSSQNLLFSELHRRKLFTQIPINNALHRAVRATEHLMIPTAKRLRFNSQVHFQMHEKVDFFSSIERREDSNRAGTRSVN